MPTQLWLRPNRAISTAGYSLFSGAQRRFWCDTLRNCKGPLLARSCHCARLEPAIRPVVLRLGRRSEGISQICVVWGKAVALSRLEPPKHVGVTGGELSLIVQQMTHPCYSDKRKFRRDLSAARNVNISEWALFQNSLQMTLNHRVPGSSPGAPTKPFKSLARETV
jgi:hypothetical protein